VKRPDDQRERYLDVEEIGGMKVMPDQKMYRKVGKGINQTFPFAADSSCCANHRDADC
jgi:hypothetical protein